MGGYWYRDRAPKLVQCPNSDCKHTFSSGMKEPKCSKCYQKFWADYNLFKTNDDRVADRKIVFRLAGDVKKIKKQMYNDFVEKNNAIDELIRKMETQLTPL